MREEVQKVSKHYTIIVHTIEEDGLPPEDFEKAGLIGRVAFIFDGNIYSGWPINPNIWEDSETAKRFTGIKKWVELPVAGWEL
jgi:hypothetical protein